jgi:hypothetical protein
VDRRQQVSDDRGIRYTSQELAVGQHWEDMMKETRLPLVFGLLGEKGSGKDTVAQILEETFGFARTSFGKRLYAEVAAAFPNADIPRLTERDLKESNVQQLALINCVNPDYVECALALEDPSGAKGLHAPRSLRWVLQTYGTNYRREQDCDYWTRPVLEEDILAQPDREHVISDVRFFNELDTVWKVEGLTVRVRADWLESVQPGDLYRNHSSEREVAALKTELVVMNRRNDLEGLRRQVESIVREARQRRIAKAA